jgi:hypothetical protein
MSTRPIVPFGLTLRPFGLTLGLLAILASTVLASTVTASPNWRPFGALKIIVSDEVDDEGTIYFAAGQFLVQPSTGSHLYLLSPKDFSVHRVEETTVATDDGVPMVDPASAGLEDIGVLEKDGGTMKWKDGEVRYALSAKPPLLGEVDLATLRGHTDKYEYGVEIYTPRKTAVSTLAEVSTPTEIVVAFGVWCPVCADWLPRFIKTIESADNPNISVRYVAINESLDQPAELLETYSLDGVPVFSVRQGDREIARIDGEALENDQPLIEEWLARSLTS